MKLSDDGAKFIAGHELPLPPDGTIPSKYLRPYNDPSNFATIAVGHLIARRPVSQADHDKWGTLSQSEAYDLFKKDLARFTDAINTLVTVPLTDNQFTALTSLAFNIGVAGFKGSTLLRKLNAGDYQGAANEFPKWNKSAGKVLGGLVSRRAEERELFLKASATTPAQQPTNLTRGPSAKFGKGEWMHPVFRQRLEALHDDVPFSVTSAGRSTKRQAELYRLFKAGRGNPANRPGTSWHEYEPDGSMLAQAADIEPLRGHTDADLHQAAGRHKLHFPLDHEPWHIQPIEAKSSARVKGQGLSDDLSQYGGELELSDEEDQMYFAQAFRDGQRVSNAIWLVWGWHKVHVNDPPEWELFKELPNIQHPDKVARLTPEAIAQLVEVPSWLKKKGKK